MTESRIKIETIVDAVILLLIALFLLTYFEPGLLFLKTTINGGDTGSHYPSAVYLKEVLLPHGIISGWDPGNYAGYPLFYHYFPLPFLWSVFLSIFFPLQIAFKLATVTGIFMLPLCAYFSFRALKYAFPIPVFAAILTLPFLFNEGNSMWGGNISSTLAGEFCYGIGLAFSVLFFGTLYAGVKEKKFLLLNALLIAVIGLCHAFALIFALMIGLFFAIDDLRKNFFYLFFVYGLGFLFMAFWILPLLANLPYVTSYALSWTVFSVFEIIPKILIPFIGLSVIAFIANFKDKRTIYFIYTVLACAFLYFISPRINILDIRFVPFFQIFFTMFAATLIFRINDKIKMRFLLPVILFLAVAFWTDINTHNAHSWINWNYSGYERKNTWDVFNGINQYLKSVPGARVEWEHTPLDEALGSIRTSETLPYFTGKPTLEGIHMLGAISAPFVFYIESETSYQSCNPLPNYFYSTFNLKRGIDHFKMFNVSHFVVRSPQVQEEIRKFPEFKLEHTSGDYEIYRLLTNHDNEYVMPLANKPVLYLTGKWRDISYVWFSKENFNDTFLAFRKKADDEDLKLFGKAVNSMDKIETIPFSGEKPVVKSTVANESIDIETSKIGHPLLIKMSYHPNWKVTGADRIYLASPSFMIIFPTSHKIHLSFEPGPASHTGLALTVIGILLALSFQLWRRKTGWIAAETPDKTNRNFLVACIAAFILAAFVFALNFIHPDNAMVLKNARVDFDRQKYMKALPKFKKAAELSTPGSGVRCEARIFYATCLVRENLFKQASAEFRKFIEEYPSSFWTPQAYFDLAYSEQNQNNYIEAANIYKKIIADFPTTSWAKYSKERLEEFRTQNRLP